MNFFTWKGLLFSLSSEESKLKIKWFYPDNVKWREKEQFPQSRDAGSDEEIDFVESSDHELDSDSEMKDTFQRQLLSSFQNKDFNESSRSRSRSNCSNLEQKPGQQCGAEVESSSRFVWDSTELDLDLSFPGHRSESISILSKGFSFDPQNSTQAPVFLLCLQNKSSLSSTSFQFTHEKNEEEDKELSFASCRLILVRLVDHYISENITSVIDTVRNNQHKSGRLKTLYKKSFKLILLRRFYFESHEIVTSFFPGNSIVFVSNYGILSINHSSAKISLCFGSADNVIEKTNFQHFLCDSDSDLNNPKIVLFDLYNCFENQSFVFIALLSCGSDSKEPLMKPCFAMYFYPNQICPTKFEVKHIPVEKYFPNEFSTILQSLNILASSVSSKDFQVLSSTSIILTVTGFAVRFRNGQMSHCIRLNQIENFSLQGARVDVIDFTSKSDKKSFIYFKDSCEVLDWSNEKVYSSYCNVCFMGKIDILGNGCPSVLLLRYPESSSKHELCIDDHIPIIINGTEYEDDDVDGGNVFMAQKEQKSSAPIQDIQFDHDVKQNVLKSLVNQEKKYESQLKEAKHAMDNKKIFLENLIGKFSTESCSSHVKQLYLQPLVPLIENSTLNERESFVAASHEVEEFLGCGSVWRRIVDSLLVCGVEVTNISQKRQVFDLHLTLLPINPSRLYSQCSSKDASPFQIQIFQSTPPTQKRICLEDTTEEESLKNKSCLRLNESTMLLASLDANQILGGEDVILKALVSYSYSTCGVPQSPIVKEHRQIICCDQFSFSAKDFISEQFSLKPRLTGSRENTLNEEDVFALDCIQKSYDLEIRSVLTSVLSLLSRLKVSSHFFHIPWLDQYIVNPNHILGYCRIKWLNQNSRCEAKIRVFARNPSKVILLVQFLHSLVSKDVTIAPLTGHTDNQPSVSVVKTICQSLINEVDDSIAEINKKLNVCGINEPITNSEVHGLKEKGKANLSIKSQGLSVMEDQGQMAAPHCDTRRSNCQSSKDTAGKKDEALESQPKSPVFQSSNTRQGKKSQQLNSNFLPSSSYASSGDFVANSNDFTTISKSGDCDLDDKLSMPNFALKESKNKDLSKAKGKSGKGGISKGKSKLMMKR